MTFYALISVRSTGWGVDGDGIPVKRLEVAVSAISEAAASAQKALLMADVTSFGYEPYEGQNLGRILFEGPLAPGADYEATGVSWAQGQTNIPVQGQSPFETISVYIDREWCQERSIDSFIFEYQALAEMLYSKDSFYGDAHLWMYFDEWRFNLDMSAYSSPTGLGLLSFKIFSVGPGLPPDPFWAGLQNCAETV